MFHDKDERFIVEMEIDGKIVLREEYTAPRFLLERAMLKRKAERDSKGKAWALFVIKKRMVRTWKSHKTLLNENERYR